MENKGVSVKVMWCMTVLRIAVGWHFLYEGLWKLCVAQNWSAGEYLRMSRWIFAPLFDWIARTPWAIGLSDKLVVFGLVAIGLGLVTGVLARAAAVAGIALVAMFYAAYPPFLTGGGENHFLLVNYNILEAVALAAVVAYPGPGLWDAVRAWRARKAAGAPAEGPADPARREMLAGLAAVPAAAVFGGVYLAKHGLPRKGAEVVTSASYRLEYQRLADLKRPITERGTIKSADGKSSVTLSRVILGGNLIGGWAHSRDLSYVNNLMKAYNSERRIYDTMHLAEKCGINSMLTNPALAHYFTRYWKEEGGKMMFLSDCGHPKGALEGARISMEAGAASIYIQGEITEILMRENKWDEMGRILEEMRKYGVPTGIGAHSFGVLKGCVEHGIIPDYWMKTFHPVGYWSARHPEHLDNIWCPDPEEVKEFFAGRKEPFIAFKTMAAGAVHPKESVPFVFNGGADFACMGMFDFQVVEDTNIVTEAFDKGFSARTRPWCA